MILQRKGFDATFRVIPVQIPTLDELGLPKIVRGLCDYHQGMILVTGATGQGKSTTLAAMIDHINSTRPVHILTIEDPYRVRSSDQERNRKPETTRIAYSIFCRTP